MWNYIIPAYLANPKPETTNMDTDAPDYRLISDRRARAAKTYTCVHCGGLIPKNTLYYRIVYISDGKFHYSRQHSPDAECFSREYESDPALQKDE